MSTIPPKRDRRAHKAPIPAPEPAEYDDELSQDQLRALRRAVTQDESKMGAVVHEFKW